MLRHRRRRGLAAAAGRSPSRIMAPTIFGVGLSAKHSRCSSRREPARPHVILADIGLPGQDGYALHEVAADRWTRVARDSGDRGDGLCRRRQRAAGIAAGFRKQCTKPLAPDALARAIVDVLADTN